MAVVVVTPDPTAAAVLAALTLCERIAAALPDAPIRIAATTGVYAETRLPVPVRGGLVTLHVDGLGVLVVAERRGDPRALWSTSFAFPRDGQGCPQAARVAPGPFAASVGAAVRVALLVLRETAGAR